MNLIERLGEDYVTEMCHGAFFYHNDNLYKFLRAEDDEVFVMTADTLSPTEVSMDADVFQGWSIFRSEPAGYRRLGDHVVAYCTRQNTTRRGLRPDNIRMAFTPASQQLSRIQTGGSPVVSNTKKISQFLRPTFDNLEESLPRLLAGEQLSIVLNENLVIEVAVGGRADAWYHILNRTSTVGRLNRQGRVIWNNPEQSVLIPTLQAA